MKNEKFCFNKGTGLIALLGIVLVAAVFAMNYATSTPQQSTNAKASFGCPSNSLPDPFDSCPTSLLAMNTDGTVATAPISGKTHNCCFPPTVWNPRCPSGSTPDVFNNCPQSKVVYGATSKNTITGNTHKCCNWIDIIPGNSGTTGATATPAPILTPVPTVDPRTTHLACTPDAASFMPADFGCNVCASSTKLADLKNKLFTTNPGLYGQFGTASKIPDYFAAGNAQGVRTCYAMFGAPRKTGAAGNICISESCVDCVNKAVDAKYCVGTAIDCSPNKTKLAAIVTAYNAKNWTVARAGMNELFKLSNTQVKDPTKSACYMPGAAVKGTSVDDASFAMQTVGYCGYLQLSVNQQIVCSCATMTNMDNPTCKSAMTQISAMAR